MKTRAYMALELNNAQSELLPIEIGFHQIGSGLEIREYASRIKIAENTLADRVHAARVVTHVRDAWETDIINNLTEIPEIPLNTPQTKALEQLQGQISRDCMRHLATIHAAPEWMWSALVAMLVGKCWREVEHHSRVCEPLF